MKFLVFILSVYVLVLAVNPCEHSSDEVHCGTADHENTHGQEESEDGNCPCSPFCSCSCVSAFVVSFTDFLFKELQVLTSNPVAVVVENLHNDFTPSFWQPPKL